MVHLFGIRLAAKVNDLGVFTEMIGVVLIIVVLSVIWIMSGNASLENLLSATKTIGEKSMHFSSFALSLLLGAWGLTGFEAAADLAEETKSPTTSIPRAVMLSLITSAIAGFLILLFLVIHAQGQNEQHQNLLIIILEKTIGLRMTYALLLFVLVSIFACGVASMATASRLLFSFARDKIIPLSSWVSVVGQKSRSPKNATLVIWMFSCLAIVSLKQIEIISSISAIASYLGYAGIMMAALMSRSKPLAENQYYYKKNWQRPIQIMALIWTIFVIVALAFPETEVEGFETKHLPIISTSIAISIGVLLYLFYVRNRIKKGIAGPPTITK
jgi:amino acid transporter